MSTGQDRLEEIERYLGGDLTASEKDAFEKKLSLDATLAEEVEMHRTAVLLIKSGGIQGMKKHLESYSVYAKPAQFELPIRTRYKWYGWAAAASVILILSYVFLIPGRVSDPEKLFIAYFIPPPAERQLLRDDNEMNEKLNAFQAYEQNRYHEATLLFENVLKENPDDDLLFYTGASALADNQPEKAIIYFTELLKDQNSLYRTRTQWYLSLAYLKKRQPEKAKEYLGVLAAGSTSYQEKSKKLLDDME